MGKTMPVTLNNGHRHQMKNVIFRQTNFVINLKLISICTQFINIKYN